LQDFGLALLVGLLTGAYSSIFIASPLLAWLKEKEPRYATIRQRVLAKGTTAPLTPAAAAAMAGGAAPAAGRGTAPLRPAAGDDEPLRPAAAAVGAGSGSGSRPRP